MKRTELKRKPPKPKKCSECPTVFPPRNSGQVVCSPGCGIARAQRLKAKKLRAETQRAEKAKRKELRARKEAIKSKGQWNKEAQAAFNWWVRERDWGKPCPSCGKRPNDYGLITGSRVDAGHYRSRGAMPQLRFEPLNCHAQCVRCNRFGSGMVAEYRMTLIRRIGLENVEWLEQDHPPKKYTIEDLKRIKAYYNKAARDLKKQRESTEGLLQ